MTNCLRVILPLSLALFLLISNQPCALRMTKDYTANTATIKSAQLTLNPGTAGATSIASTQDYATVTTTAGFTFYQNASPSSGSAQTYHPTSMALVVGTNLAGGISNLTAVDGVYVSFGETNGSPAWDFYFNFTGVSSSSIFNYDMYEYYQGNPGHTVEICLYNFSSSSWIVYEQFHGESGFTWHNHTTSDTNGLIQSGTVMGRLVHISGGSTTHVERIDYIALSTSGAPTNKNNTDFSVPTSSGSFTLPAGSSVLLYSPTFASARTIYAGSWVLDLWAAATSSGTLNVGFEAINSAETVVSTAASGTTGAIGTTQSEVITSFSGVQISVPAGGRLVANISNPVGSGRTFTIYWGLGQSTNYQTPSEYDYVVEIANSAAAPYYLSLSVHSSSGISRLTNLTVTIYSPSTNQIIINNGAFTQSTGPTFTILASSSAYIKVHASANAYASSNVVLLMKYRSSSTPFAYDVVNLTVN